MTHVLREEFVASEVVDESIDYRQLIHAKLEQAAACGFDLAEALQANYSEAYTGYRSTVEDVVEKATDLACEAQLDMPYFDRQANLVLLMGAADSWLGTEQRALDTAKADPTISDERQALVDIVLIAAGPQSGVVRELQQLNPSAADKYIHIDPPLDLDETAASDYLESLANPEVAAQVEAFFAEHSELFGQQLAWLGVPDRQAQPIGFRVLNMALGPDDLLACGLVKPVAQRLLPDGRPDLGANQAERDAQEAVAKPLIDAYTIYVEKFGNKFGSPAAAWVSRREDGSSVMTLTLPYAYGLLHSRVGGKITPRYLGLARHERTHTLWPIVAGVHGQIGLSLEEWRAVWNAEGYGGYADVMTAMGELGRITGTAPLAELTEAVKTDDPLSAYLCAIAGKVGLRTALLLAAAKPAAYRGGTVRTGRAIDMRFISTAEDVSPLAAVVCDTLRRRGDVQLHSSARKWISDLVRNGVEKYVARAEIAPIVGLMGIRYAEAYYEALDAAYQGVDDRPGVGTIWF